MTAVLSRDEGYEEDYNFQRAAELSKALGPELLFGHKFLPVELVGQCLTIWAIRTDDDYKIAIATLVKKDQVSIIERSELDILEQLHKIFPKSPHEFMGMAPEQVKTNNALLNDIVDEALRAHATDIHFQYIENDVNNLVGEVLFRVDRSLLEIVKYRCTADEMRALMNVLAQRAGAPESELLATRGFKHEGAAQRKVDIRVQFLQDKHGRTAAMRLNGNAMRLFTLDELNMMESVVVQVKRQLQGPAGLHLLIGPQGVGKTTTLAAYAAFVIALRQSRGERVKIVTAEEPIDIRMNGVTQIEIVRDMTFAQTVRSFAKADPDFMIVGEINDAESMEAVLYATMLGRPCAGSTHAMNALSTFEKLRQLGADIISLQHILRTLLAQRMLRRLCPKCSIERIISADEKQIFEIWKFEQTFEDRIPRMVKDVGDEARRASCTTCDGRGYFGVFPVFELVVVTPAIIDAVKQNYTLSELEQVAIDQRRGYLPMSAFALVAAAHGHVSLSDAREAIFER